MPKYFYTAKSLKGEVKSGVLEAKDIRHLSQILHNQDFVLIKADQEESKDKKIGISLPFLGVSLTDKMFFTRNLQVMISAGLPLPRALGILSDLVKSKKFKKTLSDIRDKIVKGESFSDSLTKYPEIFSDLYQNMVKVGEETGGLENSLKVLSVQMEREHDLKSKVQGAMIYPAIVIAAMFGIGILMLIVVVPQLAATFKELGIELPLTTRLIIALATFLTQRWYFSVILFIFLIFAFWRAPKFPATKKIIDKLTLKLPIVAPIIKNTNSAYTTRALSSLISTGVPLPRSLEITAQTLGNIYYQKALNEAATKIRKGEKLSDALKPYQNIYPATLIQMISVGEESGETSSILTRMADFYEEEVSNTTKNLASVIEPILMLIIGAAVGFFAVSMIQPMYSMLGAIK